MKYVFLALALITLFSNTAVASEHPTDAQLIAVGDYRNFRLT